jgi:NAD(P)-dependent dehydrogenase (short-subunit alcohol dehydrogenase family)
MEAMAGYRGKTVAITGGATGIGFALAKAFGQEGANIVIGEPRPERLDQAIELLHDIGVSAKSMVMDVSDPVSVEAFADFAWDSFGQVDLAINNAGISVGQSPLVDLPLEKLHKIFGVNFFGVWHGCATFGRRMITQGTPAAIYNLGSENSLFVAVPNSAAYVATKHAVLGLTEAFRAEMPDYITVGTIFPGFVASEMIPEAIRGLAMETDRFAAKVAAQIHAGERFIVTHACNRDGITPRREALDHAYDTYAPRYEGDDEYDVGKLIAKMSRAK